MTVRRCAETVSSLRLLRRMKVAAGYSVPLTGLKMWKRMSRTSEVSKPCTKPDSKIVALSKVEVGRESVRSTTISLNQAVSSRGDGDAEQHYHTTTTPRVSRRPVASRSDQCRGPLHAVPHEAKRCTRRLSMYFRAWLPLGVSKSRSGGGAKRSSSTGLCIRNLSGTGVSPGASWGATTEEKSDPAPTMLDMT